MANSLGDAVYVISNMFTGIDNPLAYLKKGFQDIHLSRGQFKYMLISLTVLFSYDYFSLKGDVIDWLSSKKLAVRWAVYYIFVGYMLLRIPLEKSSFIYFQF